MVEDFTVFFNAAEHAFDALLDGVAVTGIFEHGYAQQLSGISTTEQADGTGVTLLVLELQ